MSYLRVASYALSIAGMSSATAQFGVPKPPPELPQRPVVPMKELLITDPAVVDSGRTVYPGAFSIGHLFDEMAGQNGDGRELMRDWLECWNEPYEVNGDRVGARPKMRALVVAPWQEADGWDEKSGERWFPDFKNAPFRLLAVVNRLDLGNLAPIYYGGTSGAEGRLVFGVIDREGKPLEHHFTVIFEYKMIGAPGQDKQMLARQWHALGERVDFDEAYLADLEALTRQFTDRRRSEDGKKELGSDIAQVRTNEMALAPTCEMREFRFKAETVSLNPGSLAQTPRMAFAKRGSELHVQLVKFLRENQDGVIAGSTDLPEQIEREGHKSLPLLAGSCTVPDRDFYWETGGVRTRELRRVFSRRTCNGCHARDTDTDFCHIRPRLAGEASTLSKFLSLSSGGYTVEDPGEFFEEIQLNEMHSRVQDLLRSVHGGQIGTAVLLRMVKASLEE